MIIITNIVALFLTRLKLHSDLHDFKLALSAQAWLGWGFVKGVFFFTSVCTLYDLNFVEIIQVQPIVLKSTIK